MAPEQLYIISKHFGSLGHGRSTALAIYGGAREYVYSFFKSNKKNEIISANACFDDDECIEIYINGFLGDLDAIRIAKIKDTQTLDLFLGVIMKNK